VGKYEKKKARQNFETTSLKAEMEPIRFMKRCMRNKV
jgi:hypothetical protein